MSVVDERGPFSGSFLFCVFLFFLCWLRVGAPDSTRFSRRCLWFPWWGVLLCVQLPHLSSRVSLLCALLGRFALDVSLLDAPTETAVLSIRSFYVS